MDTGLANRKELNDTYKFSPIGSVEDLVDPKWFMTINRGIYMDKDWKLGGKTTDFSSEFICRHS